MKEVTYINPEVIDLFDPQIPNRPILYSALEAKIRSNIFVDDPEAPTMAVLRTPDGITFFSNGVTDAFLRGSLRKLQHIGPVMAIAYDRADMFPKPDVTIPRYDFLERDRENFSLNDMIEHVPSGMRIFRMDKKLMEGCEWRELIELSYGTMEGFLEKAYGFCLVSESTIITETYAAFIGRGNVEIGVLTSEPYRGRGYGTWLSAYIINDVEEKGLQAMWSCDQKNEGSVAVARKLGFHQMREYFIYGYRPLKVPVKEK